MAELCGMVVVRKKTFRKEEEGILEGDGVLKGSKEKQRGFIIDHQGLAAQTTALPQTAHPSTNVPQGKKLSNPIQYVKRQTSQTTVPQVATVRSVVQLV